MGGIYMCLLRWPLVYPHELVLQAAYACMRDSPGQGAKGNIYYAAYTTIDLSCNTCRPSFLR